MKVPGLQLGAFVSYGWLDLDEPTTRYNTRLAVVKLYAIESYERNCQYL